MMPVPKYFTALELHERARAMTPIRPPYPAEANNQPGRVELLLLLSAKGTVDAVSVLGAEPPGIFEESALNAFREAVYAPGRIAHTPVRSQLVVEIIYDPGTPNGLTGAIQTPQRPGTAPIPPKRVP